MKARLLITGKIINVVKNDEFDAYDYIETKTGIKYYKEELEILDKDNYKIQEYLDSLDKEALLSIIKYGLRGSDAPEGVTVEDIYELIGCQYISETM